jgi:hypothetical protein
MSSRRTHILLCRTSNVAAALAHYDHERRARTQAMALAATWQLRFGQQLRNPIAVAIRNTGVALRPDRVALLAIARYGKWRPPAVRVLQDAQAARASSGGARADCDHGSA